MNFLEWLETYQQVFPFAREEEPLDIKKIRRFKNQDNYIKAMMKGGKKTEKAAEKLISSPIGRGYIGEEEIVSIHPNALRIPKYIFQNGVTRPERYIAFVHVRTKMPVNPNSEKYNKSRYRLLAFWQGDQPTFTEKDVMTSFNAPIGGLSHIGGFIDTVWVDPEFRGQRTGMPNLYKSLREFARNIGYPSLEPGDDLTSKSYRASQAKHDWKRAFNSEENQSI